MNTIYTISDHRVFKQIEGHQASTQNEETRKIQPNCYWIGEKESKDGNTEVSAICEKDPKNKDRGKFCTNRCVNTL